MTMHTPLHGVHVQLRATFTEFAGWSMPMRYVSETVEHHAVRERAGLFDLSHMGEIEVSGPEAARSLDRALVGRASAIATGRARYSMLCAEDGGILDDLVVYRLRDDRFMVVANAANTTAVAAALAERARGHDTVVHDVSDQWALIAVQGPAAAAIVGDLCDHDVSELRYYGIQTALVAGIDVLLARTGYTGEDGFEVYCRPEVAVTVWEALAAGGRDQGIMPAGLTCRDTLRLEAGMPLYGRELNSLITPFDAGLGRFVAFGKPDGFVGESSLLAQRDRGANRVLVGLVAAGRRAPRTGHAVLDPATGGQIGTVTSGAPSPTLGRPIAMAYLPPDLASSGRDVHVDVRGQIEEVRVVNLPFYTRPADPRPN